MKQIPAGNVFPNLTAEDQSLLNRPVLGYLKGISLIVCVGITIQTGLIAYEYFRRDTVLMPAEQTRYQTARKNRVILSNRLAAMQLAIREDAWIVPALDTLASLKPAQVKWTDVEVAADKAITLEGAAADPALFGEYVAAINLEKDDMFRDAKLTRMTSSGNSGIKAFTISAELTAGAKDGEGQP